MRVLSKRRRHLSRGIAVRLTRGFEVARIAEDSWGSFTNLSLHDLLLAACDLQIQTRLVSMFQELKQVKTRATTNELDTINQLWSGAKDRDQLSRLARYLIQQIRSMVKGVFSLKIFRSFPLFVLKSIR